MAEIIFPDFSDEQLESKGIPLMIAFILDGSGSMSSKLDATISGFNEYLGDLKRQYHAHPELGEIIFTLTQFNTVAEIVYAGVAIDQVRELTEDIYKPTGNTALYDAIAKAISAIEQKAKDAPIRPKIQVTIQTDGEENASRQYSRTDIFNLINAKKREGNWTFTFLGCEIDAYQTGADLGVPARNIRRYQAGQSQAAIRDLGHHTGELRASRNFQTEDFYDDDSGDLRNTN